MASETIVVELALVALSKWRWSRLFSRRSHDAALRLHATVLVTRKGKISQAGTRAWEAGHNCLSLFGCWAPQPARGKTTPLASLAVQLPTSGISPMISSILAAKIDLRFQMAARK
jgi:hypothetical protein